MIAHQSLLPRIGRFLSLVPLAAIWTSFHQFSVDTCVLFSQAPWLSESKHSQHVGAHHQHAVRDTSEKGKHHRSIDVCPIAISDTGNENEMSGISGCYLHGLLTVVNTDSSADFTASRLTSNFNQGKSKFLIENEARICITLYLHLV